MLSNSYALKRIIILFVILFSLYGCFDLCDSYTAGQGKIYYKTKNYELHFKDTSNKFTGYWTSFLDIKYEFSATSNSYSNTLNWDVGIQEKSMIVLWHKKGIDTIICNLERQKLEYIETNCSGDLVNLNLSEPTISYHTFDSIYNNNSILILE